MKIEYLLRYGLPDQLVKRWAADGMRTLLPIQESSVTRFGILDGKSVVICGPGTSGKTFCGELGALARVAARGKAIFLEPLKAVAEEKFRAFHQRYSPLGIKTVLSTRDHTSSDDDIFKRNFDIAIFIYEKFNSLTSFDISLVKNAAGFVIDEFQMISDPKRGIELELAILKIRRFNPTAQVISLLGSGSAPDRVSQWLGAPALNESHRPVELRLGVLRRGKFHFKEYNHKSEGDEQWVHQVDIGDGCHDSSSPSQLPAPILAAIKHLADQGEQVLIFARSKNVAMALAGEIGEALALEPAESALAALADCPPSFQNEALARCLRHGVAFHHADLDEYQRGLVENGFRAGGIRILASTSTLALGVNLPARNVFIETQKYVGDKSSSREQMVPLSAFDFHQAAGRAGRLRLDSTAAGFGRAIMTAATPFEEEILWDKYVYGRSDDPPAGLNADAIPEFVLRAISCGAAADPGAVTEACAKTYASLCGNLGDLQRLTCEALVMFEKSGLVRIKNWGKLETTALGRAASATGLGVRSAIEIIERHTSKEPAGAYDWLAVALGLVEWSGECGRYYLESRTRSLLLSRIYEILGEDRMRSSVTLCRWLENAADLRLHSALASFLFATEWSAGRPTHELEQSFGKGAGGLKKEAATLAWILTSICRLMGAMKSSNHDDPLLNEIAGLAERIHFGVAEPLLPLARAVGIDREFIRRLSECGIGSIECLLAADTGSLAAILPGAILNRVLNWRENYTGKISSALSSPECGDSDKPRIVFTGRNNKLKCEVVMDGVSVWLQPRLFAYMQKLWAARLSGSPWVPKEGLDTSPYQSKYISKLKKQLRDSGVSVEIASNGRGGYAVRL